VFSAAVAVLAVLNANVCVAVARSAVYSHHQKVAQFALIWLVPVIGALIVWLVLRQAAAERRPDHYADPIGAAGSYSQGPPIEHHHNDVSGADAGGDGGH
jgi:hypothetical protein